LYKDGAVVLSESALRLSAEEQRELADAGHDACYTRKLDGSRYLLFSEASGMGLHCAVGVPSVQILRLLYQVAAPYVIAYQFCLLLAVAAVIVLAVIGGAGRPSYEEIDASSRPARVAQQVTSVVQRLPDKYRIRT